jgi:hypothetical protein
MEAQEISVQSKPPKSFKLSYRIEATFDCVTGMVVDNDDNLILADEYFLRNTETIIYILNAYLWVWNKVVYELNTFASQGNNNSSRLFVLRSTRKFVIWSKTLRYHTDKERTMCN